MSDIFKPSKYQEAIFKHIKTSKNNLCVEGVAGCGKTKTLVEVMKLLSKGKTKLVLAFNKSIQEELEYELSLSPGCTVKTTHAFGLQTIRSNYSGKINKIENNTTKMTKLGKVFDDICDRKEFKQFFNAYDYYEIRYLINVIIPFFKYYLFDVNEKNIYDIISRHGIEIDIEEKHIGYLVNLIKEILEETKNIESHIDYDDMNWLPIISNMIPEYTYHYIFVDEAQDLNRNQFELIKRVGRKNAKFIFIGDRNQSIYGFRGADIQAIPNIIKEFNCDTLPLDISYRCPKSHVKLAQIYVPNIKAAPNAIEGIIEEINVDEMIKLIQENDLVICRTNAPLIALRYSLFDNNINFRYKNKEEKTKHNVFIRDIIEIIKKYPYTNIADFKKNILSWKKDKIRKSKNDFVEMKTKETYKTLLTFCNRLNDNDTIHDLINEASSQLEYINNEKEAVELSTIHGAKGLENERVFLLSSDLHHWASIQENNVEYVSITRSKNELYFVSNNLGSDL